MRRADPIASPTLWVAVLFVALLFGMPQLAPLFQWSFPGVSPPVFERGSFFALWLSHAGLVLVAGGAAIEVHGYTDNQGNPATSEPRSVK